MYEIAECAEKDYKFKYSFTIKENKRPILHVHFVPRSSAIRQEGVSIKICNWLLYTSEWAFYLNDICGALGIYILNITRADVCCDVNKFANGMRPKDFIHEYVSGSSIIRKGSNKFCMIGTKGGSSIAEEYLRFGSRASACSAYLYNKSKELKDKKYKPYIVKAWEDCGLDTRDVWRVELSITSKGLKLRNQSGRVRRLSIEDLSAQYNLQNTFFTFALQYWTFHDNKGQKFRKDMRTISLFPEGSFASVVEKPSFLHEYKDSGRSERCAARVLERVNLEFADFTTEQRCTLYEASILLNTISSVKRVAYNDCNLSRYNDYLLEHMKGEQITMDSLLQRKAFNHSGGAPELMRRFIINNAWRL